MLVVDENDSPVTGMTVTRNLVRPAVSIFIIESERLPASRVLNERYSFESSDELTSMDFTSAPSTVHARRIPVDV